MPNILPSLAPNCILSGFTRGGRQPRRLTFTHFLRKDPRLLKNIHSSWNWSLGALWEPSNHEWRGSFENRFAFFFYYHQTSEGSEKATWSPEMAAGLVASNCPPPSADVCSLQSFNGRFHGNLTSNVLHILRNHANYLTVPAADGFKMTIRVEPFGVCHGTV